jgi:hypothetical protein
MAELIPIEYRIEVARQALVKRWIFAGALVTVAAAAALVGAYAWQREKARIFEAQNQEYQKKLELVKQAQEIQHQRETLAARMQKLQALRDDNVVLSLLKSVTDSVSDSDCLSYLQINANLKDAAQVKNAAASYRVRLEGITNNDSTHSKLLERLTETGKKADPPVEVPLGEREQRKVMQTEVTYFDITCAAPGARGK